ncbi:hypothetical protein JOM56_009832 [Amanita muscaria]
MSLIIPELIHELNSFPWYLGHICASWRAVFVTMPLHFWNKLDIKLDFLHSLSSYEPTFRPFRRKNRYELMLHALRFFLDRTSRHPFSFQLERQFHHAGEEDYIGPMLEMLVAESMRLEDVLIRYQREHVPILYRARNHLSLLRSVQLVRSGYDIDGQHSLGHNLLEGASCLRSVSIADLLIYCRDCQDLWTPLRVRKIGRLHRGEQLLSVLSQANQLEKLAIYQSFSGFDLDPSIKLLTFESLEVLAVTDLGLLSIFYAPCLEELYINDWDDKDENIDECTVHNAITSFLLGSSCSLKCFGMAGCRVVSLSIILRHTPDLVHLTLDNYMRRIQRSLEDLIFHRQRRDKLPAVRHLQSLTLLNCALEVIEMELCTLLVSRARRIIDESGDVLVEKLRRLSIVMPDESPRYRERAEVGRLRRQCQDLGVQFTIDEAAKMPWRHRDNIRILDW